MAELRRRDRPGHDEHPLHGLRPRRQVVAVDQKEHQQIFPQPGWVEHDPAEIWPRTQEVVQGALEKAGIEPSRPRRRRHHQPARDRPSSGTGRPASRSTTRSSGRTPAPKDLRRARGRRAARTASASTTGLPLATYFSGPKIRWILDNVDGRARAGRARRAAVRHHRLLADLEPHRRARRRGARHRRHQRQPHDADGPADARLGRRDRSASWASRAAMLPGSARPREVYGDGAGRRSPGIPVAGVLGDQQAALFGQTCFDAGRGQEHLRHRQLPAAQHRHRARPVARAACSPPSATRSATSRAGLRARRLDRRHRLARAVAARQPRADQDAPEVEDARRDRRRQRRRVLRARLLRPVRPVLAERRPRRDRRPHPLRQQGPPRPRRAGGHRLPDPRGGRRDERRLRRRAHRAQGRRRHGRQRPAHAVPGRRARRARWSARR